MLIRTVLQHPETKRWGYVEMSDENPTYSRLIGNKDFGEEHEAIAYSKGFRFDSYEWVNPISLKIEDILKNLDSLQSHIEKLHAQVEHLKILNEVTNQ